MKFIMTNTVRSYLQAILNRVQILQIKQLILSRLSPLSFSHLKNSPAKNNDPATRNKLLPSSSFQTSLKF